MDALEGVPKRPEAIAASVAAVVVPDPPKAGYEAAFQDTAFALMQLIEHMNKTTGSDTIVIDEEAGLILDADSCRATRFLPRC